MYFFDVLGMYSKQRILKVVLTFGTENCDDAYENNDANGDGVEIVVAFGEAMGVDAEVIGLTVAEGGKIGGP